MNQVGGLEIYKNKSYLNFDNIKEWEFLSIEGHMDTAEKM